MTDEIKITKLTNLNYIEWSYMQMMLLKKEKLWKYVTEIRPIVMTEGNASVITASQKAAESYDEKSEEALTSIALSVSAEQISIIRNAKNAKEAWEALKAHHNRNLRTKLRIMMDIDEKVIASNGNMFDHIMEMEELFGRSMMLGDDLSEDRKICSVLRSIRPHYGTVVDSILLCTENSLTLADVEGKIIDEWKKRQRDLNVGGSTLSMQSDRVCNYFRRRWQNIKKLM